MRFVLTAYDPAAGWNPPTTGPTNHGQAQTLLRYRPRRRIKGPQTLGQSFNRVLHNTEDYSEGWFNQVLHKTGRTSPEGT